MYMCRYTYIILMCVCLCLYVHTRENTNTKCTVKHCFAILFAKAAHTVASQNAGDFRLCTTVARKDQKHAIAIHQG